MHHPEPTGFVRRIMLQRTATGKPYAVFRANELNPPAVWGKPVPYCTTSYTYIPQDAPILAYDNHIAPLFAYLSALEATQHLPIDAPWQSLYYEPLPNEPIWTFAHSNMRGASHQDLMRRTLQQAAADTYRRIQKKYPALKPGELLTEVVTLVQKPRASVRFLLNAAGITLPSTGTSEKISASKDHKFHKSYEWNNHYTTLKAIIQQCRAGVVQRRRQTGRDEECSFSIADLYDSRGLGGYAVRCPVIGEELDWVNSTSYFSPRVGRYDPEKPFVTGNVVLMSLLGKKVTEGRRVQNLSGVLNTRPFVPAVFSAWSTEHPVPSTLSTGEIRARPITDPAPAIPTLEEQRAAMQEIFDRRDSRAKELQANPVASATEEPPAYDYYTPEDLRRETLNQPTATTPPQPNQPPGPPKSARASVLEILGGDDW